MFKAGKHATKAISGAMKDAATADMVVSYWGRGAYSLLGLAGVKGRVRIICDLWSGACNPHSLLEIADKLKSRVEIRTYDNLHAKVYWTPAVVIVGSMNASTNGLGDEGQDAGTLEAAIQITDAPILREISTWMSGLWSEAKPVNEGDLKRAVGFWQRNRGRGRPSARSLLQELADTTRFKDRPIRLWFYVDEEASDAAHQMFQSVAPTSYGAHQMKKYEKSDEVPFYERSKGSNWNLSEGEHIIDFTFDQETGRVHPHGIWRVRDVNWRLPIGGGDEIILLDQVESVLGAIFPRRDQQRVAKLFQKLMKSGELRLDADNEILNIPLSELPAVLGKDRMQELLRSTTT